MNTTKVLIADKSAFFKKEFKHLLEVTNNFKVVGYAKNSTELIEMLSDTKAEIVFIHYSPLGKSFGTEDIKHITQNNPAIKIIVSSAKPVEADKLVALLKNPIHAFILNECCKKDLVTVFDIVASNNKYLCSKAIDSLVNAVAKDNNIPKLFLSRLSEREKDIAAFFIKGYRTKEIAQSLSLSPHTVCTHRKNIFKKLGVHCMAELIHTLSSVKNQKSQP